MTFKKYIILFLFLLISIRMSAQEAWTLDECVSYALEHNLQLNDFKYTMNSGKETYRQSVRNLLPSVNGSVDYNINYGRSEDPNTGGYVNTDFFSNNYAVNASMDLFQGFQKLNSIKASKFLYKAAMEDVQQQKYLLAFRVMTAYYDIKFYEGLVINSIEQAGISQTNYNLVKKQIELGLKAGADLYEAEAALLGDQLLVTQNKNLLAASKLTLLQEMNLENVEDIELTEEMDMIVTMDRNLDIDSVYNSAKEFIPLLKGQELRAKAAKKQLAAARGLLSPSLSIFSGFGTGYFETNVDSLGILIPFNNQIKDNTSRYIGVSLNVPISNGWSGRSRVKQQKINMQRANNAVKIQEQELFQLIQQLVQENNALKNEVKQSAKRMESQELAFTIAQKRYDKGLINALELFQAKNLFGTAQNENLQVRLRLRVNEKTLDFYGGLPIFNIN
ncbi:outer membrane protein TolC [Saonia flava]|uniref:Outer membrane protein TolC n=2 Tax=Saonia flava TaxID=523696 RepID=A0A846QML0_9FLAO|nr:outer membrane protein TolC [Saonia flava]